MTFILQLSVAITWLLVIVWLWFLIRYPSPRDVQRFRRIKNHILFRLERLRSRLRSIPSTLARDNVRATVRMLHAFATDEDDPLRLIPDSHELLPVFRYRLPTLAAKNSRASLLYWNIVYDERREEEVLWIGGDAAIRCDAWNIKIVWRRDPANGDWLVAEWSVNNKLQFVPIPDNLFPEKCMLSNMLCAVKTAKAAPLLTERPRV
jgi:hypothetical protein